MKKHFTQTTTGQDIYTIELPEAEAQQHWEYKA